MPSLTANRTVDDVLQEESKRVKVKQRFIYNCCHGPEDDSKNIPPDREAEPRASGSRRKEREWGGGIKTGCQARFTAVFDLSQPDAIEIQYFFREHTNPAGLPCHGEDKKHGRFLSESVRTKVEEALLRQTAPRAVVEQIRQE